MSLVSVIIPSFNNAQWLSACIESCLIQDHLKEIIIVDNQSTDGSLAIIESYISRFPDILFLYHNPNKGANYSRNLGFSTSSGQYIQWLDSDDRLLPEKFAHQIAALETANADIVYSDWEMDYYDETSGAFLHAEYKKNQPYPDFLFEILLNKNWSSPNTYLLSRKMATQLHNFHGWNPETVVEQDREYFTLAAILGAKFVYAPGNFAIYNRWSPTSISKLSFEKRLEHSSALAQSFILKIHASEIPDKAKYINLLKTELLVSKYYHSGIKIDFPITWKEVYWPMVHWKMRLGIGFRMLLRRLF